MVLKLDELKSINLIENITIDMFDINCYQNLIIDEIINNINFCNEFIIYYDNLERKFTSDLVEKDLYFPVSIKIRKNSNLEYSIYKYIDDKSDDSLLQLKKEIQKTFCRKLTIILNNVNDVIIKNNPIQIVNLFMKNQLDESYLNSQYIFDFITSNNQMTVLFFFKYSLKEEDINFILEKDLTNNEIESLLYMLSLTTLPNVSENKIFKIYEKVYLSAIEKNITLIDSYLNNIVSKINNVYYHKLIINVYKYIKNNKDKLICFISALDHFKKINETEMEIDSFFKTEILYLNCRFILDRLRDFKNIKSLFKEIRSTDVYEIANEFNEHIIEIDFLNEFNVHFDKSDVDNLETFIDVSLKIILKSCAPDEYEVCDLRDLKKLVKKLKTY